MSPSRKPSRLILLFGLGLAVALALAALGATLLAGGSTQPASAGLPDGGSASSDKSLGVNTNLQSVDAGTRVEILSAMNEAGLRWLRLRFPWDTIEAGRGEFDWTFWDKIVRDADENGLELIAVLDGSPSWARPRRSTLELNRSWHPCWRSCSCQACSAPSSVCYSALRSITSLPMIR